MIHIFRKLRYYYISPLDKAMDKYRKTLPLTPSQQSEVKKHTRIAKLRDSHPDYPSTSSENT